jgi:hypothetical protein
MTACLVSVSKNVEPAGTVVGFVSVDKPLIIPPAIYAIVIRRFAPPGMNLLS